MTPKDPGTRSSGTRDRKQRSKPEPNPDRDSPTTTIDTPLTAPPGLSGGSN
jgi:hypothetical protein